MPPAAPPEEERSTGLPKMGKWTFNLDIGMGGFGFANDGELSAVGERTFAAPPPLVGSEASSFQVEDAYLGWRSGESLGTGENLLEFTVGRTPYKIGHGFLLWDGAAEGGSRGRLLEQRAQGPEVRRGRPRQAEEPHPGGVLPRPQ